MDCLGLFTAFLIEISTREINGQLGNKSSRDLKQTLNQFICRFWIEIEHSILMSDTEMYIISPWKQVHTEQENFDSENSIFETFKYYLSQRLALLLSEKIIYVISFKLQHEREHKEFDFTTEKNTFIFDLTHLLRIPAQPTRTAGLLAM